MKDFIKNIREANHSHASFLNQENSHNLSKFSFYEALEYQHTRITEEYLLL